MSDEFAFSGEASETILNQLLDESEAALQRNENGKLESERIKCILKTPGALSTPGKNKKKACIYSPKEYARREIKKYKKLKSKSIAKDAVIRTSKANQSIYKKLLEEKKQKVKELVTKLEQVKSIDKGNRIQMAQDNINQLIERDSCEANIKSKYGYDLNCSGCITAAISSMNDDLAVLEYGMSVKPKHVHCHNCDQRGRLCQDHDCFKKLNKSEKKEINTALICNIRNRGMKYLSESKITDIMADSGANITMNRNPHVLENSYKVNANVNGLRAKSILNVCGKLGIVDECYAGKDLDKNLLPQQKFMKVMDGRMILIHILYQNEPEIHVLIGIEDGNIDGIYAIASPLTSNISINGIHSIQVGGKSNHPEGQSII